MDCKEFESLIPMALEDKLKFEVMEEFYEHRQSCPECREELEIRYLVSAGLNRLEDGDAFDLKKELDVFFSSIESRMRKHRLIYNAERAIEGLFTLIIILAILWIMN